MTRRLLHGARALHACDDARRVLRDAWVVVEGPRIAALGEGPPPEGAFDERLDLAGCLLLPGLVNPHHHVFQTLTRAVPAGLRGALIPWLRVMYPLWSGITPADIAAATRATAAELLLTGCTASADHAYLMPGADPAFAAEEVAAARAMGLRLHLVRGSMTEVESPLGPELEALLGPRAGGLLDEPATVLAAMREALRAHHAPGHGAWTTVAPGPTVATFEDLPFMRAVAALAAEHDTGLHMHLHPRPDERALCAARFGRTPLEVLDDCGWLGPRSWFAHGTRLEEGDIALLAARGAGLAHCPRMIARLGVKLPPIHALVERGVRVAVGVDGGASNDGGSMLAELRLAMVLHRLWEGGLQVPPESWLNPDDLLWMATRDAAAMIGRPDLGQVAVGAPADLVAFDLRPVGFAGAGTDPLAALLLTSEGGRAALTMTGGEVRVRHGVLLGQDEHALRAAVDAATSRLLDRAAALTGQDLRGFAPSALRR